MADKEDLSLEQIENDKWGDPPPDATRLVTTGHRLRRKPLRDLQPEDLRLLIGQHIGIGVLVPRALALLEHDPLTEGDFYPGDVLVAVLKVPTSYWQNSPDQYERVDRIVAGLRQGTHDLDSDIAAFRARLAADEE